MHVTDHNKPGKNRGIPLEDIVAPIIIVLILVLILVPVTLLVRSLVRPFLKRLPSTRPEPRVVEHSP